VLDGHCSYCHKVWTLETGQGLCQWCGRLATSQTTRTQALRSIKSRSNGRKRQDGDGIWQSYDDHLDGEWLIYNNVASKFAHKAQAQDRDDLRDTIILNLAVAGRNNGHKPDNPSWMYRIASFTVAQYWRDYYKHTNGLDCGHCNNPQRKRCKAENLYRECPKAMRIESLNKPIVNEDGYLTELGELIADDNALDLAEWLDIKTFLAGCPQKLIDIAEKRQDGIPLTKYEQLYLCRFWGKQQKSLL
jgi:hypothetical protein